MLVVGLTSGIGCGKTTVAGMFRRLGAKTIDADMLVSELYRSPAVRKMLSSEFGREIISPSGGINRRKLAEIAFSCGKNLKKLNSMVHPFVIKKIRQKIREQRRAGAALVVVDVPLLFESGLEGMFGSIIVVKTNQRNQMQRLLARGFSRREAILRINAQKPLREKIKFADFVIDNNHSPAETRKQAREVFRRLMQNDARIRPKARSPRL